MIKNKNYLFILYILLLQISCENSTEIENIVNDYFPLSENDTLLFEINSVGYNWGDKEFIKGEYKWIVDAIYSEKDTIHYSINEQIQGESMLIEHIYNTNNKDTTYSPYFRNYYFTIKEVNDTVFWNNYKFCKKPNNHSGEYLNVVDNEDAKLILRRNFGLDYKYWFSVPGNSGSEGEIIRIYK